MGLPDITIDPDFRARIPPLAPDERDQLEENLLSDGCRDPLVVWSTGGVLLDGHHRYAICHDHNLPFQTVALNLPDRASAEDWIDANQLGRRNLTPEQASLLRGRRYNRTKRQGERTDLTSGQNVQKSTTAERLASQHGVTERTIRRDGDFAQAVADLVDVIPDIESRVMAGEVPSKQAVLDAWQAPAKAEAILSSPHVARNTGNTEWDTPDDLLDAARRVMGGFDCDPASSDRANARVQAATYYTAETNGLDKPWGRRVWMNPPYAQPLIQDFAETLAERVRDDEVREACILVNNATETSWFAALSGVSSALCLVRGRVKFLDADGQPMGTPLQGQVVFYVGSHVDRFEDVFADHVGSVWVPHA